ncbi:right-handed parallel beta-helix repeat-containing protein [Deinococcus sp. UR1]|uniref:right-handed parallel beta-helix repeat-containing protein n=1 Tax=Deinococcus sp. UR1 TaxID=1704277 RepID=UPI000C17A35F|nr:right-handed parallel beta-helix repeat-containing protein [Deinococcus sp. UR1]
MVGGARFLLAPVAILAALTGATTLGGPATLRLEAENGLTIGGQPLPQQLGAGPAWVNRVGAASGGREVRLSSGAAVVRFLLPRTLPPGRYQVSLNGYGQLFRGAPVVALRVNDREVAQLTFTSPVRVTQRVPSVPLAPGDVLEVRFLNDLYGGPGQDRNAVLDFVELTAEATSTAGASGSTSSLARAATPTPARATAPTPKPASLSSTGTVSVTAHGAVGDGRTDDTAALTRALNSGAATVTIPKGQYLLSAPVVVTGRNLTVQGQPGAELIAAPAFQGVAGSQRGLLWLRGVQNVSVRNLGIDGRRGALPVRRGLFIDGVLVSGSTGVTLSGLHVRNAVTDAIAVLDSGNLTTEDNVLGGMGRHGVWTRNVTGQRHLGNTITGLGNRTQADADHNGIGILATLGADFTATGNTIRQMSDTGTKTEGVSRVLYRGNTVENFGKDGIKAMPYPPAVKVVTDVRFEDNRLSGLHSWRPDGSGYLLMQSVVRGVIAGNTVLGSAGRGAPREEDAVRVNTYGASPPSTGIVIEGNTLRDTRRGLRVLSTGAVVRDNTVTGAAPWARSGVIVGSPGVQVLNNTVSGPVIGVLIDRNVRDTRVQGNSFERHEQAAVFADNQNDGTAVIANRFGDQIGQGIVAPRAAVTACQDNVGTTCP